jgi:hypothetical protein
MTAVEALLEKVCAKVRATGEHNMIVRSQKEVWGVKSAVRAFKKKYPQSAEGISLYVKKPGPSGGNWLIEFRPSKVRESLEASLAETINQSLKTSVDIDALWKHMKGEDGSSE